MGGLTATAPIGIENAECPSNAVSALQCSGDIPPHSPRCFSNFSAAGVHCTQGYYSTNYNDNNIIETPCNCLQNAHSVMMKEIFLL